MDDRRRGGVYVHRGRRFVAREIKSGRMRGAIVGGRREILTRRDWLDEWVTEAHDARRNHRVVTAPSRMMTTANETTIVDDRVAQQQRLRSIAHWRNVLIDCDLMVDDCREAIDADIADYVVALRERDRAAIHLAHLLADVAAERPTA